MVDAWGLAKESANQPKSGNRSARVAEAHGMRTEAHGLELWSEHPHTRVVCSLGNGAESFHWTCLIATMHRSCSFQLNHVAFSWS